MASRLYELNVTVPAGTLAATPQLTQWPLENNTLDQVEIVIPSGHVGLTGVRVLQASQQIVPWGNSGFISSNDEKLIIPLSTEIGASAISVQTYNTDVYPHTFYLRATVRDIPIPIGVGGSNTSGLGTGTSDTTIGSIGGTAIEGTTIGDGSTLPSGGLPPPIDQGTLPPLPELPTLPALPELPGLPGIGPASPPPDTHHDQQVMLIQS